MNLNLSPIQDELNKLEAVREYLQEQFEMLNSINWEALKATCSDPELVEIEGRLKLKRSVLDSIAQLVA